MAYLKYTREILSAAVASSTSMAAVLRHLGVRQTGGSHAHLRRRIDHFGIDTSHFTGQAHARGRVSTRRRAAAEILVARPRDAKRAAPSVLTRALLEIGRPYRCAACGLGDRWNGMPITLQVDHVDGQFWDCRPDNLRFLCPNCHSQTRTYAGRNRQIMKDAAPPPTDSARQELITTIARFDNSELTPAQAAELIGCDQPQVFALRKQLNDEGLLDPGLRRQIRETHRQAVIDFALRHPDRGYRAISAALRAPEHGGLILGEERVRAILVECGFSERADRRAASAGRVDASAASPGQAAHIAVPQPRAHRLESLHVRP